MELEDKIRKELRERELAKLNGKLQRIEEHLTRRDLFTQLRTIAQETGLEQVVRNVGKTFLDMDNSDRWKEDDNDSYPGIIMYVFRTKLFTGSGRGYSGRLSGTDVIGGYDTGSTTSASYSMLGVELHHTWYLKPDEHAGRVFLAIGGEKITRLKTIFDLIEPGKSGDSRSFKIVKGDPLISRANFDHEITKLIGDNIDRYRSWNKSGNTF